jgi:hypothetical protein
MTQKEARSIARVVSRLENREALTEALEAHYPNIDWQKFETEKGAENESYGDRIPTRKIALRR